MTLLTRLLISHVAPLVIVMAALAVVLSALFRIGVVLTTLGETELHSLQDEGVLHRAGWALDVEMRHGQLACSKEEPEGPVRARITRASAELSRVLDASLRVPQGLAEIVHGYLEVAEQATAGESTCANLLDPSLAARRAQLDEQLTNLWVARLDELHQAVRDRDGEARSIAVVATWMGLPLALASCVLALVVARRMARSVKEPLAQLARVAERVGRGDFRSSAEVHGPSEIEALAEELERMRTQLAELEALKQGFLASVSHELRTPLSKIREALALLSDGAVGELEERQLRVVQIARTACEREIRMVTTLLDLSRLRAGSPIRMREHCAIDAVLQVALNDERADATARGVSLELLLEGEAPPCRMDPALMERAVANLVRNAVSVSKASQRVRVQRDVVRDAPQRPGTWIRLRVEDEGPGVPREIREQVFDAFVTGEVTGVGRALGVGIGLALAREVARAHGGDLELVRGELAGACFELWLPTQGREAARPGGAPATLGIENAAGQGEAGLP